jgi:hypothetical protein
MLADLIEMVTGLWGPTDPETQLAKDTRKRANRAYAAAWKKRTPASAYDDTPLLLELRALNVPGSFGDATQDAFLTFYFESWRKGTDPKAVRAHRATTRP